MSAENKPNLIWCAEDEEPYPEYREGLEVITISPAQQRAGFYYPDPQKLRTLSGGKLHPIGNCGCGGFKSDLPENFPCRELFVDLKMNLTDVQALDRDALIALKKIDKKKTEKVLEYLAKLVEGEQE